MKIPHYTGLALSVLLALTATFSRGVPTPPRTTPILTFQPNLTPKERWDSIAPFFSPPKNFDGVTGDFRSVMKFDDGTPVTKPSDWPKRRKEIRAYWDEKLGAWPALLESPTIDYYPKSKIHYENYTRYKINIQLTAASKPVAYLFVPDGVGPFPAVVSVYYDAETSAGINSNDVRSFGPDLARRGFVTLCLAGSIVEDPRKAPERPCQPLMYLAYAAANANTALAQMEEVDPQRIGIIGHSFGGKWAMFASCLYDKYAAAVWSEPSIVWDEKDGDANYWDAWYLGKDFSANTQRGPGLVTANNPRTGPYKELVDEHHDLHELHALMAPRPFLVSGGDEDPVEHWAPLNGDIALYKFLGYENRVAMTNRKHHRPTPESNEQAYRFFEHFLKDEPVTKQNP